MQLFYNSEIDDTAKEIDFSKDESRHICRVLRKRDGDTLSITNGKGSIFSATLVSTDPKKCSALVTKVETFEPLPYRLHLAVAPTKLNDRYEWFLEKATEIGITEITPIICDHSERKAVKLGRYSKILQSAMKQSLKAHMPKLNEAVSFKEFITSEDISEENKFIAHCEKLDKQTLKSQLEVGGSSLILIGPEGDFSTSEIELALATNFRPVSLGASRLRTETAAVVACHSVAFINEE